MRRVFFSFHYAQDVSRAALIRNIGALDANRPASDNDWEKVKRGGDQAIRRWIKQQLHGRSCTIVLVGAQTAQRPWVRYEIEESWNQGKGLFGIRIHGLKDLNGKTSRRGANPFRLFSLPDGRRMDDVVPLYDPPGNSSQEKYRYIAEHLEDWIEEALDG